MMKLLKIILFYPLMFLRIWVKVIIGGAFGVSFILLTVMVPLHIFNEGFNLPMGSFALLGGICFGSFIILNVYDLMLLKLNPHDTVLVL